MSGTKLKDRLKQVKRVRDFMTVDPMTVGPRDSLRKVVELLRRRDIRSVAVVEEGIPIGIVTDRDVRQVAPGYPLFRDEEEIRRIVRRMRSKIGDARASLHPVLPRLRRFGAKASVRTTP